MPDALVTAIFVLPEGAKAYGPVPQQVFSAASGEFHFMGLEAGRWSLRAESETFATARAVVDAGARGVRIQLSNGGSIAGMVRDATGRPVPGFTVIAQKRLGAVERGEDGASRSFYSADGRYRLDHLPSGQYSVTGGAAGFAPSKEVVVHVRDGAVATADVALAAGGTIRGQVLEAGTSKPIAGAWVSVSTAIDVPLATGVLSERDGGFVLSGAPSGWFSVTAIDEAHMGRVVDHLRVGAAETIGPITIPLRALRPSEDSNVQMVGIGITMKPVTSLDDCINGRTRSHAPHLSEGL